MPLLSGLAIPLSGFSKIPRYVLHSFIINIPQSELRISIPQFGETPQI